MLLIGISGMTLTDGERDWIANPAVSGVILFTRNFESRQQVTELIDAMRMIRPEAFLVCVDQEGGRVQRFREGFTTLPPLARLGEVYSQDPARACELAEQHAWLMASEMRAIGIDLSFAPVVDLARGNLAIGDRAFDADPTVVSELGLAYVRGMRMAGMAATIKHFPGHGSVLEDTHFDAAIDPRPLDEMATLDLVPFEDAIAAGAEAVMMAHVTYPAIDSLAAGYSPRWIGGILRGELGFEGAIFSDDIGMAAAESVGGVAARIHAHLDAGCDFVLVCHPALVPDSLAAVAGREPASARLVTLLQGLVPQTWAELVDNPQRAHFVRTVMALSAPQENSA
jgi:beta-N-acetylhexosaminidase